jgi:nitrite reductase/ring-hydroxylating ferredoxin subunit
MGNLLRQYWIPILLAEELPENECPPVRVNLLCERLVAWRDSRGRYALIDEFCAHRGVSLWFGRNEENGLRCPYHGWKYDRTGQCVDVPSEPPESGFCKRIKLKSYPLVESGGILWAYMGPPEAKPALPAFEWTELSAPHRYFSKRWQECNYLQAMEGGLDSNHVSFEVTANQQFLDEQPRHDGLAGARIVGEQETQRLPRQHFAVNGGDLVGQRLDLGGTDGEIRIEKIGKPDAVGFGREPQQAAVGVECVASPRFQKIKAAFLTAIDEALADSSIHPKHQVQGVRAETRDLHDLCGPCGEGGFPDDFAGLLVGRDDPRRPAGSGNDEISPQGRAAVSVLPLLFRVHAPHDPPDLARGSVDLVEHAPGIGGYRPPRRAWGEWHWDCVINCSGGQS